MPEKLQAVKKEIIFALLVPLAYLILAFVTIGQYGVSFDEAPHFRRGQGYLHFFLTGKKTYADLPKGQKRSNYQSDAENGELYIDTPKQQSHPPINDTLAALTNYVFYQKLGILDDVDSHHVFGIMSVFLLIFAVYLFTRRTYGIFAAFVASISIFLYPIFLAESHFNIKDPPETSFFTITLILLYFGIIKKSARFILFSSLFFALALGTKFNIVFLPFILLPWLLWNRKKVLPLPKRVYKAFILYPVIVIFIFLATNPNLWVDTHQRIITMIQFYLSSGTNAGGSPNNQPDFLFFGFNIYPFLAILYSTPLVILFFSVIGMIKTLKGISSEEEKTGFLILLWFFIPIVRVTLPGFTIYGGIRHIFEYIPAMAILAGIGADYIVKKFKQFNKRAIQPRQTWLPRLVQIGIVLSFLPITLKLISIHPNENVYFNPLIGGLRGATAQNFPNAGASLGNPYMQGVDWLNKHAENGACVTTPLGVSGNIPYGKLRKDIIFTNTCQSNLERKGEYAMEMEYASYFNSYYAYAYYSSHLYPVYSVIVDDTPIFRIFKNDKAHSKKDLIKESLIEPQAMGQENNVIDITLPKIAVLSQMNFYYDLPKSCNPISQGYVLLSRDGSAWEREPDNIQVSLGKKEFQPSDKKIERKFAAKKAKYIKIITNLAKDCEINIKNLEILYNPDARDDKSY